MQCSVLSWILGQKKNLNGKTGEIQIKPVVYIPHLCYFLSFDKCTKFYKMLGKQGKG
jgi:hypothetical protein